MTDVWTYTISTGVLSNGTNHWTGYSGNAGATCNNVGDCGLPDRGPIPPGVYYAGKPIEGSKLGPFAIPLSPQLGTQTFGRSGLYMHGDSIIHPGHASDGCICQPLEGRKAFAASGQVLEVVP